MKILITGGAGFVGTNLISKILKEQPGTYIQVLDNYSTGSPLNIIDNDRVTYHEFDLTDYLTNTLGIPANQSPEIAEKIMMEINK